MSALDDIRIDRVLPGQYALRIDPTCGIVMPWYTHGALDEIHAWDLSDKTVLEWGGGCSTFWWAKKCRAVYTIEAHSEWCAWLERTAEEYGIRNIHVHRRWPDPVDRYVEMPAGCEAPDIVVIDGSLRTECLAKTLTLPRPITVIFDNWQQDYVFIDEAAEAMMAPYVGQFFIQHDHADHQGKPWQTAIWRLE